MKLSAERIAELEQHGTYDLPTAELDELLRVYKNEISRLGMIERAEDALHELLRELDDARDREEHTIEDDRCDYNFHVSLAEFRDDNGLCCHCGEPADHENHLAVYVCKEDDDGENLITMQERAKQAVKQRAEYEAKKAARKEPEPMPRPKP